MLQTGGGGAGGNKYEKLQTFQFVCAWFPGGGVLIIRKRLQQLHCVAGFAVVHLTSTQHPPPNLCSPPCSTPLHPTHSPPHLHSVKLPPLSVHDSLSPADSDNSAPCVLLQVLQPLLQPNRPLVILFFSLFAEFLFRYAWMNGAFCQPRMQLYKLGKQQTIHQHQAALFGKKKKKKSRNLHCSPSRLTWETSLSSKMNFDSSQGLS